MAGQDEKKPGIVGLALPFLIVLLVGAGAGFGGFKILGSAQPKSADTAKPAAEAAGTKAAEGSSAKPDGQSKEHGESKTENKDEAARLAHEAALLEDQQKARVLNIAETNVVPLPPIIANLANPSTTWVRLEASIAVKKDTTAKPADIATMVSPKVLAYLKSLKLNDLQGAVGLEFLESDLNEIARTTTSGQVQALFLTGFVVE